MFWKCEPKHRSNFIAQGNACKERPLAHSVKYLQAIFFKMDNRIKDENYYQVQGWMKNRLGLKGTKRDIYAIIYGFSQDGESEFTGSIKYLVEWLDVSRPTIIKALQELTDGGYLIKRTDTINGVQFNRYKANLQVVKFFNGGSKEILLGGSKETLPNNKNEDNELNNSIKERTKAPTSYDVIIKENVGSERVAEAIYEFIKMRTLIKKPLTDRALQLIINKVNKLSGGNEEKAVEILNQSITNNWQDVYAIKGQEPPKKAEKKGEDMYDQLARVFGDIENE